MQKTLLFITLMAFGASASAWSGTDESTGAPVEIEKGNLVRTGETIEYFDHEDGEYKSATVDGISRYGSTVEVDITDDETGEMTTLEMDD